MKKYVFFRCLVSALSLTASVAHTIAHADPAVPDYKLPNAQTLADTPEGDAIRRGKLLLSETKQKLPMYAGNGLNCSNCHLGIGTVPYASPWVGLAGVFPEYRARSGKLISLQERINDCFQRSLNGKALPYDSTEMNDMLSYMRWISAGLPIGSSVPGRGFVKIDAHLKPDLKHGEKIYTNQCAACHGVHGEGLSNQQGGYVFPPLWGKDAFNNGAGMARLYTAAAFVKQNMPLGQAGTLSAQDAVDVAAFFTQQDRPDFPDRVHDWPKGQKPVDAR